MLGYVIYDRVTDSRSGTLFSLQSPLSGRDKKQIRGGFVDQRKGVGVGEEETIIFSFSRSALRARSRSRSLASVARPPIFSKRTKRKIKQRLCSGYVTE